jgi:paraquat-inducible protein B
MINNGLRAKLQLQSFVTGQLLVAFNFYPDTPVVLMNFENDIPELPTLPSDMEALAKTFDSLDFQAIAESITNVISSIEKLATSPQLHEILATLDETLAVYRQLAADLDRQVAPLSTELTATLADARRLIQSADGQIVPLATQISGTAADVRQTIGTLDQGLQPILDNAAAATAAATDAFAQAEAMLTHLTALSNEDSTLVFQLEETLAEIRNAAGAMAVLVDYLARHPEALLMGRHEVMEER